MDAAADKRRVEAEECIRKAEQLEREAAMLRRRAARFMQPDETRVWTALAGATLPIVEWDND